MSSVAPSSAAQAASATSAAKLVRFTGHKHFARRLIYATLTGRPVRFDGIRSNDLEPGLRDYEVSLLRLLEAVTNGAHIEISYTGTTVLYKPGLIHGGTHTHECPPSRSISYFLYPLLLLAPFTKQPLSLHLKGITADSLDLTIDTMRTGILPLLTRFGVPDGVELRILKRGAPPLGGGEVHFLCPNVRNVKTIHWLDPGRISRIRGIAASTRVSPAIANRMVEAARGVLNRYIPDVYIYTDVYKGAESGNSPGFSLSLVAECANTQTIYTADLTGGPGQPAEDVGKACAKMLLREIRKNGAVDSAGAGIVLPFMVLGSEDVGRCDIGARVDENLVEMLRDIKTFWGAEFLLREKPQGNPMEEDDEEEEDDDEEKESQEPEFLVSCMGTGFVNTNKKVT
ncbi:hypothetical protein YB2330_002883 [Saitoella coloradoensis]